MRTVGEILKKARIQKHVTLEEAEKHLRIRKKFLAALEANEWSSLPGLAYIKGFLRNYSIFLDLKSDEMLAIFRRQFTKSEVEGLIPEGVANSLNNSFFHFTPQMTGVTVVIFLVTFFLGYLFLQYRSFISAPSVEIETPQEGEVVSTETILVKGKTDTDAVVSINKQRIALSDQGEFSQNVVLTPGTNTIVIETVGKSGKQKTITRSVQRNELAPE